MSKFKKGDKVRCIIQGETAHLTKGKIYEVTNAVDKYSDFFTITNDVARIENYLKAWFEPISSDDDQFPSEYISENLDFLTAIKQLGMGHRLGIAGTDWSWYYKWGTHNGEFVLVNDCDEPVHLSFQDYVSKEWIISSGDDQTLCLSTHNRQGRLASEARETFGERSEQKS